MPTAYELVYEAAQTLGRDGTEIGERKLIEEIRRTHSESPHKDSTLSMHIRALTLGNPWAARHHPTLARRAFLVRTRPGFYRLAPPGEAALAPSPPSKPSALEVEDRLRQFCTTHFGMPLVKTTVDIFGKPKEFDLVNKERAFVGDVKHYTTRTSVPSAEFSVLNETVWLMERLEVATHRRWRKVLVGSGNREIFDRYAKLLGPWLADLELYFVTSGDQLESLRTAGQPLIPYIASAETLQGFTALESEVLRKFGLDLRWVLAIAALTAQEVAVVRKLKALGRFREFKKVPDSFRGGQKEIHTSFTDQVRDLQAALPRPPSMLLTLAASQRDERNKLMHLGQPVENDMLESTLQTTRMLIRQLSL